MTQALDIIEDIGIGLSIWFAAAIIGAPLWIAVAKRVR